MGKMHGKARTSHADVIMLDMEDSVPFDGKLQARETIIRSLLETDWGDKTLTVRINGLDTPFGYRDLLEVAEAAGSKLNAVVIPKVHSAGDIHFVSRMLDGIEMNNRIDHSIGIEASIESAEGLENVSEIAAASPRLISLVFGIADFSASIGARLVSISGHGENESDIYPGHRWHYAMSCIVTAAKARGLIAIDSPYGNFRDMDGLSRSAVMTCSLGYDGKWAIHPDQIATINAVFSPSQADIDLAQKVLEAYRQAKEEGRGAVAMDGRMIDNATVRLAQRVWNQAEKLGMVAEHPSSVL
jgi:citrate lyase beta subunit